MNVVIIFLSLLTLHLLTFAYSLQDVFHLKPILKKTFHYELLHPKLSNSAPRSVAYLSRPVEISTRLPPSYLPPPKLAQPPPLVPDILNNLFQEPSAVEEIPSNHLDDLFTPNTINEPAVTVGQLENYKKDLEEQAMEEQQEQKKALEKIKERDSLGRNGPKLHVSVNSGLYKYNYTL